VRQFPLVLLAVFPCLVSAQDARDIIRRAVDLDRKNLEQARNYTYVEHQETRILDSAGALKEKNSRTTDVIWLEGSPYRQLVAKDDKPLPSADQQKEDAKLRSDKEIRSHETAAQRNERLAAWDRRQARMHEPLSEAPDAFTFKLAGEETLNGRAAWVIDAVPVPGYKPKHQSSQYLPHVKARLWIDKANYQWLKADGETLDTIAFGAFLVRVAKGTHIVMEQAPVDAQAWMLTRVSLRGSVRIALVKVIHGTFDFAWNDFKRAPAEQHQATAAQ